MLRLQKVVAGAFLCLNVTVFCFMPTDEANRQSSYPFITGDTFRSFCDWKLDEAATFNPSHVENGDIIFVSPNFIDRFFSDFEPKINARFVILTHNSDEMMPGRYRYYLDNQKLIAWFSTNLSLPAHPKLFAIPIGFANRYWSYQGPWHGNPEVYKQAVRDGAFFSNKKTDKLVYVNFARGTNPTARDVAYNYLSKQNFVYLAHNKAHLDYLREMATYRFVASPLGNGIDCHRTWEALAVGTIPIVQSSSINELYNGLPVIIIDDWSQVTPAFLEKKYEVMKQQTFFEERKYIDYWIKRIEVIRTQG